MQEIQVRKLDWVVIALYLALLVFGWMNVYSSLAVEDGFVWSLKQKYVMDLIWIGSAMVIAILILFVIPSKIYPAVAWPFYGLMVLLLIAVIFVGVEINGSKSWFAIGSLRLQPAEFSKISTSILLAHIMSKYGFRFSNLKDAVRVAAVLAIPMMAIVLEKETGSALIYLGFLLVCYREGMSGWILIIGILAVLFFILTLVTTPFVALLVLITMAGVAGAFYSHKTFIGIPVTAAVVTLLALLPRLASLPWAAAIQLFPPEIWVAGLSGLAALVLAVRYWYLRRTALRNLMLGFLLGVVMVFSTEIFFQKVLKDYQQKRIEVLLGITKDTKDVGYNVHQSLVAIGSGGFTGKGYLGGTQTRFEFVPEQSTDFIFCTVGEEWGFLGAIAVLAVYLALILRIITLAERQKDGFARVYGWCVAVCLLMHVVINICMTVGLMPVIGIPLPLLSYGGSSMWAFTILIFIFLRLDMDGRTY